MLPSPPAPSCVKYIISLQMVAPDWRANIVNRTSNGSGQTTDKSQGSNADGTLQYTHEREREREQASQQKGWVKTHNTLSLIALKGARTPDEPGVFAMASNNNASSNSTATHTPPDTYK